jgi:hypothetical protein
MKEAMRKARYLIEHEEEEKEHDSEASEESNLT